MNISHPLVEQLRTASPTEKEQMLASFIESFRSYLELVAERQLPNELRAKVAPSDIIQNTYIEARNDLKRFDGTSDRELLAWLCRILLNNAKDATRQYQSRQKRQVSREVPIEALESDHHQSSEESPSRIVSTSEEKTRLCRAVAELPKEYRQVVVMRSFEHRSLAEIALVMHRSEDAVRKLFARALIQLERAL